MQTQFQINDAITKPGKISNNLEKHGDEEVTVFAIPFSVAVDADTANAIAGDPHFTRSVFNDNKGFLEPMPWVRKPIRFPEKYDGAAVSITLPSDEVLTFEKGRVDGVEGMPLAGGLTQIDFQLQIAPGVGRENLLLQEYQHRELRLSVTDAKIALKKDSKTRNLELVGGGAKEGEGDERDSEDAAAAERERIRQANETERQLGEALRGLEGQGAAA